MHKYNEVAVKWFFVGFLSFFVVASCLFSGCSMETANAQDKLSPAVNLSRPQIFKDPITIVMEWVTTADKNFHTAVTNGDLKSTDPIILCFDAIAGTQNPNAQPYDTSNLGGIASVAYIKINALQSSNQNATQSCDALTGKFFRDMLRNAPVNPARPILGG